MANIAINEKSTKTELINFLRSAYKEVVKLDKVLAETIKYSIDQFKKDPKSVIRTELWDFAQQAMQIMGIIIKPVEMSSKLGSKSIPLASIFPPELVIDGTKFVAAPLKYQNIDEVRKVLGSGKILVFATYWTKRHISQFDYVGTFRLKNCTMTEFPNDLDIMLPCAVLDKEEHIITHSFYTDASCIFTGDALKSVEDQDANGNKFTIRFNCHVEFEVYEAYDANTGKPLIQDDFDNNDRESEEETPEQGKNKEPQQDKQEEVKEEKKAHKPKIMRAKTEPKKDDSVQMTLNDGETPANNNSGNTVTE